MGQRILTQTSVRYDITVMLDNRMSSSDIHDFTLVFTASERKQASMDLVMGLSMVYCAFSPEATFPQPSDVFQAGWSPRMVCITAVAYLIVPAMTYTLACLNSPSTIIMQFMNQTEVDRTGQPLSKSQTDSLYGLLVAVIGIGAAVGSLTSDVISEYIGRKYALFLACVTGVVGTLTMTLCVVGKSYEMLFVGRTINGFALGWGLSLAPTYIMEMCQPHQKGTAAMAGTIAQGASMVASHVCGFEELLGNEQCWQYLIGLPLVLLCLQLILLPLCPQNPRYLLMKRNDEAGAIRALQIIHGKSDVTYDIKEIRNEMAQTNTETQISITKLCTTPELRRPLLTAVVMGMQQNWSGVIGIMMFSGTLFKEVGVTDRNSRYATSGTGIVYLVSNIVSAFLMPRIGRKVLYVGGMGAIGVFCAMFALTTIYQEQVEFLRYISIVVALLIVGAFGVGPVCVFWVILGEMFPHRARGAGFGVAILCAFSMFFASCFALPVMVKTMTSYTFFVFAAVDAAMVVFCIFYMPETKDKTFEDLAKSWAKEDNPASKGEVLTNIPLSIVSPDDGTQCVANGTTLDSTGGFEKTNGVSYHSETENKQEALFTRL